MSAPTILDDTVLVWCRLIVGRARAGARRIVLEIGRGGIEVLASSGDESVACDSARTPNTSSSDPASIMSVEVAGVSSGSVWDDVSRPSDAEERFAAADVDWPIPGP